MFSNFREAKGNFEKISITFVIYAKDNQVGKEIKKPKGKNIIPANPKINIKMVIGLKTGRLRCL